VGTRRCCGSDPARPYLRAEQLDTSRNISDTIRAAWGHRHDASSQFPLHPARAVAEILRLMASVGLTRARRCGDTVRNVNWRATSAARARDAVLDINQWAQATTASCSASYGNDCPGSSRSPLRIRDRLRPTMFIDVGRGRDTRHPARRHHGKPFSGGLAGGLAPTLSRQAR